MKITRKKLIIGLVAVALLFVVFWWGGNTPSSRGWQINPAQEQTDPPETAKGDAETVNDDLSDTQTDDTSPTPAAALASTDDTEAAEDMPTVEDAATAAPASDGTTTPSTASALDVESGDLAYSLSQGMELDDTGHDRYSTEAVPEGQPLPVEPQDVLVSDVAHTCTLSVRCDTILTNLDWLKPEKLELVPDDGVIFATKTVTFYEGESVFNVLVREMKQAGIHLEFVNTPIYNSAYIEGINNLYEFDCGELSGWMYKVNDWFPNYGCGRYQVQPGDRIEWVYTCNLGVDVGGSYTVNQQ